MHLLSPGLWSVTTSALRAYSTFLAAAQTREASEHINCKHIYVCNVTPINLNDYGGGYASEIKRSVVTVITPEGHIRYARCADAFIRNNFYPSYEQ